MAWNGSDQSTSSRGPSSRGTSSAPKRSGASNPGLFSRPSLYLALLVVFAVSLVAYFLLRPAPSPAKNRRPAPAPAAAKAPEPARASRPAKARKLKTAEPAPAPAPAAPEKPKSDIGRQVTNSYGRVYTIKYVNRPGVRYENGVAIEDKPLFENDALNELDTLYRVELGTRIYGSFDAEAFDKNFLQASLERIEISPDDSEEVAARKRQVIEGLQVLKDELKAGKNPSEVIAETRKEIADLANFKDVCQDTVIQMKNDGCSDEEIEFYYEEVNKKLAARNIPALLSPATVRERLRAHSLLNNGGKNR